MGCSGSRRSAPGPSSGDVDEHKEEPKSIPDNFQSQKGGTAVLLIDPQNDFHPGGSLPVTGAVEDSERVAAMIEQNVPGICQIAVTLDSHQKLHIANPFFWKNKEGKHPDPYTQITLADIDAGTWGPSRPELAEHCRSYIEALEANERFTCLVWPEHCLIGTTGHNVFPRINTALQHWAGERLDTINYINKGTCPLTEMYSGLQADVLVASDPSTQLNTALIQRLLQADRVLVCGQAKSHCVNFTLRDLTRNWPQHRLKDLVLLSDGCSSVPGFEKAGEELVTEMKELGVTVCAVAKAFH